MAEGSGPETLDPHKAQGATNTYFIQNVFEFLYSRDLVGNIVPQLATSYTVSPDGRQYTFKLRRGVTFHNGEPFDANSVKYSFERFVDPATKNIFAFELATFKSAVVVDRYTVQINLSTPVGNLIDNGAFVNIVPPNYISQYGSTYFGQHPVGTGPFKFANNVTGESWSVTRYENYWGQKAGYAGLDVLIIAADASRLAALESGEVDFITQVNPTDVSSIKSRGSTVKSTFSGTTYGLFFNMSQADVPWQNQAVRKALTYATNRPALRQALFETYAIDFSKGLTHYAPGYNLLTYSETPYDPDKAKSLLASAGYAKGFSIDIVGPADGRFVNSTEVIDAIGGFWSQIGVNANVQAIPYAQWIDALGPGAGYNGVVWADESGIDPTTFFQEYMGPSAYDPRISSDPHLNALLPVLTTATGSARNQACAAVATYNNTQCYMIPLYGDDVIYAMNGVNWTPWTTNGEAYMGNAFPA
jgi:peptide/nickel transport system substrate-binding protein